MNTERPRQRRGGVYLESTEAEQLGVLPGEERRVREVMDRRLVVIAASSSLAAAAELMRQRQVTSLIVETEAVPIGVLTDRDVAMQLTRTEPQRARTVGEAVAGQQTPVCHEDDILADALPMIKQQSLSALPVVDRRGVVVGVLSPIEVAAAPVSAVAPEPTGRHSRPGWTVQGARRAESENDQRGERGER
jgi:CBS domain-containing protein